MSKNVKNVPVTKVKARTSCVQAAVGHWTVIRFKKRNAATPRQFSANQLTEYIHEVYNVPKCVCMHGSVFIYVCVLGGGGGAVNLFMF